MQERTLSNFRIKTPSSKRNQGEPFISQAVTPEKLFKIQHFASHFWSMRVKKKTHYFVDICQTVHSDLTLSNSSIKQTPLSAKTSAPASSVHSLVTGCLCTYAVKPTAEAPWPVVNTALWAIFSMYLRNCDFAVPGSPHIKMLMSPRIWCLPPVSERCLSDDLKNELFHIGSFIPL